MQADWSNVAIAIGIGLGIFFLSVMFWSLIDGFINRDPKEW